jgi:hypothetical protein
MPKIQFGMSNRRRGVSGHERRGKTLGKLTHMRDVKISGLSPVA